MSDVLFGNNLKAIRTKTALSLQKLADCVEVSKQAVFDLEKPTANPTLKTAYKIAAVLGVQVTDIWPSQVSVVEETITVRRVKAQAARGSV